MIAHNTTDCPRMPDLLEGRGGPTAHACIPLRLEGRSRGVLNVAARDAERFDERELRFLETVGYQISLGIETARHREAERQAYRELKDAQSRVAQGEKMAALGTFASGLAHEVRNPLNSISLQLARLERKARFLAADKADEITSLTRIIREEVQRLDALVEDFLLFARPNRPDRYETSLLDLVEEVAAFMRAEAGGRKVVLETRCVGEPLPPLRVDAGRVRQVVLNLLRNAIEAMPDGGRVLMECGLVDGRAFLAVSDTGPGLPEGLDIFQLFVTTKPHGTGLGLAIAQQIVLEHGGELVAKNAADGGARFEILLPLVEPADLPGRPS
jgi:signal transduction histidine kinase